MKLWIGHYLEAPDCWFLVWANSKDEAINFVDCECGEPDVRSMRPIRSAGMIDLLADKEELDEGEDIWYLKPESDDCVHIDIGDEDDTRAWIEKRVKKPLGKEKKTELSDVAGAMGISQPEVFKTYFSEEMKGSCPICRAPGYVEGKKCKNCGYNPPEP